MFFPVYISQEGLEDIKDMYHEDTCRQRSESCIGFEDLPVTNLMTIEQVLCDLSYCNGSQPLLQCFGLAATYSKDTLENRPATSYNNPSAIGLGLK